MQPAVASQRATIQDCAVTRIRASMHIYSKRAQTSATLTKHYSSNGTMLPMLSWVTLSSHHTATERSGGYVISAQTVTCTAGWQVSKIELEAVGALNAMEIKFASTTRWLLRLPWLQLSGTTQQMMALLMILWHRAIKWPAGTARSVAASGRQESIYASDRKVAAHSVLE